jgi:hypothetical protein
MTLCGIWHGAGWPFLLWGLYHGVLIAGYHVATYRSRTAGPATSPPAAAPLRNLSAMLFTFALVSLGWLLFRSSTTLQALGLVQRALMPWAYSYRALSGTFYLHTAVLTLAVWLAPLAARAAVRAAGARDGQPATGGLVYWLAQGGLVGLMLTLCLIYLRGQNAFIYFQF